MSVTKDAESITNSMMMAMEKEFRKNGLGPAFHALYKGNRAMTKAMVDITLKYAEENPHAEGS